MSIHETKKAYDYVKSVIEKEPEELQNKLYKDYMNWIDILRENHEKVDEELLKDVNYWHENQRRSLQQLIN